MATPLDGGRSRRPTRRTGHAGRDTTTHGGSHRSASGQLSHGVHAARGPGTERVRGSRGHAGSLRKPRCAPASSAPAACCAKACRAISTSRSATRSRSTVRAATASWRTCWPSSAPPDIRPPPIPPHEETSHVVLSNAAPIAARRLFLGQLRPAPVRTARRAAGRAGRAGRQVRRRRRTTTSRSSTPPWGRNSRRSPPTSWAPRASCWKSRRSTLAADLPGPPQGACRVAGQDGRQAGRQAGHRQAELRLSGAAAEVAGRRAALRGHASSRAR